MLVKSDVGALFFTQKWHISGLAVTKLDLSLLFSSYRDFRIVDFKFAVRFVVVDLFSLQIFVKPDRNVETIALTNYAIQISEVALSNSLRK